MNEVLGTEHYASHENAEMACYLANKAAGDRASRKGTCITTIAKPENCTFADGLYTVYAISANHKGSCKPDYPTTWQVSIPVITW